MPERFSDEDDDNVFCCCVSVGLFCDALIVVFKSFVSFILTGIFWALTIFLCEIRHWERSASEREKRKSSRGGEERVFEQRLTCFVVVDKSLFIYHDSFKIFMLNGSPLNLFKIHCV